MTAAALESELRALGLRCTVDSREKLAILVPLGDHGALLDPFVRRQALELAEAHGFTHVALELPEFPESPSRAG